MTVLPVLCASLFLLVAVDAVTLAAVNALIGTTVTCPPNEENYFCVKALCRAQTCSQQGIPIGCPSVSECDEGCVCVDGTLRNEDGQCVPKIECPGAKTCPKNEEWSACTQIICRHQLCEKRNERAPCPDNGVPQEECKTGCVCEHGYLRNDKGVCVPEEQC